ncbi:O-antigen ligase family protein [Roseiconus lacunae]|uniref:O-antigen ligase family protein n=1 Tax=Roseiconus lacunae TaxID=2605694 RepID=A0ABT7PQV3_9BACT|nr:O-antigen ligase family protein [Roseiconus lacunae]MDM4018845.1 O-antigen ligase family protein [Roseiconus lacunae]
MSLTGLAWLTLYLLLSFKVFERSSYGIGLYLMTFYAPVTKWWWGSGVLTSIGDRWALFAALFMLVGVVTDRRPRTHAPAPRAKSVGILLILYILNALFVHTLFAKVPVDSWEFWVRICKYSVFGAMMYSSIRDAKDIRIALYSIVLGGIYIGYEVYFNEAGRMRHGRLEGIPLGSASDANYLSSVLSVSLVAAGYFILVEKGWKRYALMFGAALMLETIQQSLSRGTMLALCGATITLLVFARKRERKLAVIGVLLGCLAAFVVMGKEDRQQMVVRFQSIFVESEERDASADSRTLLWGRCLTLIGDNPLGLGGEAAFKSKYASRYVADLKLDGKAVHNGYLDIASSWGIQGLALALTMLFLSTRQLLSDIRVARRQDDNQKALLGSIWVACGVILAVAAIFISSLRGEWFYWWAAIALGYRQYSTSAAVTPGQSSMVVDSASPGEVELV